MSNLTLYEIKNKALELAMNEELTDDERKELAEAVKNELLEKTDGIIAFTKKAESLIDAIKAEENRLKENRKAYENKLEAFKNYVKDCMMQMNLQKIETPLGELRVQKNPISVEVIDEALIPDAFIIQKVETSVDKKGLINNFKETGELIQGVEFHDNNYGLRIK